jgi:acetolactate synthase I/II/III large subunit
MPAEISRRTFLQAASASALATTLPEVPVAEAGRASTAVSGPMTGAVALVETLILEGTRCVYGIPGAQENELWDAFKSKGLDYLLCTHEFSASCMADGYARATGLPGVCCIVPGPGITNALTGIGEALLDSVPMVVLAGDVARGPDAHPFQVHSLDNAGLLRPVCKEVLEVRCVEEIPSKTFEAFRLSTSGEPGPVAVLIPYDLLIQQGHFHAERPCETITACDEDATQRAIRLLSQKSLRVGIYAGQGCMDHSASLTALAELLEAPVATSVSGKGVINERHPLSVGWGYGTQGTLVAEKTFKDVDLLLAIGVKYSEVSTAFYAVPKIKHAIHVDAHQPNLGQVIEPDVCVHSDAGLFIDRLLSQEDCLRRGCDASLRSKIERIKLASYKRNMKSHASCGCDPMLLIDSISRQSSCDAMIFVDVTMSEHWAAETITTTQPRTYFNPVDNQAMGWSIPAALGAQRVFPGRQTITITGDGCLMMSALEMSTAVRECLPVKFFILDDGAYHYMQELQLSAYKRTTATVLAHVQYPALAQAFGLEYREIRGEAAIEDGVLEALSINRPVLIRVCSDYGDRACRWIDTVRGRYIDELTMGQQFRFLKRITGRTVAMRKEND